MKKILLIEDHAEMRENITEILELANYKVVTAPNGKDGIKLAQHEMPDLIICDIMMPELDGYGVLHVLSKNDTTVHIPFIFLTAKAEKDDYKKGMVMGADAYLTKPLDDVELLSAIETRLRKSEILKRDFANTSEGLNRFFDEAQIVEVLKNAPGNKETRVYKKKEGIFNEGGYAKGVYFINKGKVKVFKSNENGKEYITDLYKEGDFIGYNALLEDAPYQESASALEDSEIMLIPKEHFFSLLFNNREVGRKFIKILSDNVVEKENRLLKLAYNSVRRRVADALLMLQERYQEEDKKNFSISISREDIASIVGTATETVIRTLSDFKDEKLISIQGSQITILNKEKLLKIKN